MRPTMGATEMAAGPASRVRLFAARDYNKRLSDESFTYWRRADGLIEIETIPSDLGAYYRKEYYAIPADMAEFLLRLGHEKPKLDFLKRFATRGRLLEIGPATGEFAYLAHHAGFEVSVIEMDEPCARFIGEWLGLDTKCTDDPAAALDDLAPLDAICLWQVIEHIPEFWRLMDRMVEKLRAGGILILSTPNPESLQFRLLGARWCHLDAPRHLYLIPQSWFARYARLHGLEVVLSTTRTRFDRAWNAFGWTHSFRQFVEPRFYPLTDGLARIAERLAARFERREGKGTSFTVVLRKPQPTGSV